MKSKITGWAMALGMLGLLPGFESKAHAAVIVTITQSGPDVFATGSGSFNLTALSNGGACVCGGEVFPGFALGSLIFLGSIGGPPNFFSGISGPASFGSGASTSESSVTGTVLGLVAGDGIYVPQGYVSGTVISGTATFAGNTIAGLGLNTGTYLYTWGSGASADSLTLTIGTASTPEPTSLLLVAFPAAFMLLRMRQKSNRLS
ncbi:MAG: hypothetical protein ABI824_05775 [Acidobacteriota bacterium]